MDSEDVAAEVVDSAEDEAVEEAFLLALVTGNAQTSTVATPTLPGEMTATNAKPLNQLALEVNRSQMQTGNARALLSFALLSKRGTIVQKVRIVNSSIVERRTKKSSND